MYYVLLTTASLLAVSGLLTGNESALLGSMLISPILVPIFNITSGQYGVLYNLAKLLFSIVFATTVGYFGSFFTKNVETNLMKSRTLYKVDHGHLFTHSIIPYVCGFVLALAKYSNDYVTIVGVSLALAILPPLVNAGIYIHRKEYDKARNNFELSLLNLVLVSISYIISVKMLI